MSLTRNHTSTPYSVQEERKSYAIERVESEIEDLTKSINEALLGLTYLTRKLVELKEVLNACK